MQFQMQFTVSNTSEIEQAARLLCKLAGFTIATGGDFSKADVAKALATPPLVPLADLPSAGVDTAAVFGQRIDTPPPPPAVVTNAGAAQGLPVLPATGGAVELDGEGLPWDERIHSSNHKKGDNGMWMMRRGVGVQKAMVERVKAELRATLPSATPAATVPAPVFPSAQVAAPALPALPSLPALAPTTPQAPAAVAPTIAPAAPLAPLASAQSLPAPSSLAELMQQAAPLMQAGKVTPDTLQQACTMSGVANLAALATAPAGTVQMVWALLPK